MPHGAPAADVPFDALGTGQVPSHPVDVASIGEFLRCSLGLSAWKSHRGARWALRVNPSSGNLHPTEAYVLWDGRVSHYAPREHALELRAMLGDEPWDQWRRGHPGFLVGLTSIPWREAWKYGERAFRYCQHDVGHALGALRYAGALLGWNVAVLPQWSDDATAALLGVDREADYGDAERELPECVLIVTPGPVAAWLDRSPDSLARAARAALWHGRANRLSQAPTRWDAVEDVAEATAYPGRATATGGSLASSARHQVQGTSGMRARQVLLQRRSAVAFDPRYVLPRPAFARVLDRLRPLGMPWDVADWPPCAHLILFVHRVAGLVPGVYAFVRDPGVGGELRGAMRPEFLWEPMGSPGSDLDGLFLLVPTDVAGAAARLSCDQDIAAECAFSLGMLVPFQSSLRSHGSWFYRRLFWECGLVGQVLYLEAEAAGARGTGIGCYYDDAVHETLGLSGLAWQSLYHFAFGAPLEDTRLTTEPGYEWEGE